ncbi:MAG: radical SAM protein [Bacteroidales bacterium]|nr:radical SAM protein [Bacteroidales bacterium]
MNVKEIQSKTILSASKVYNYVINPYVGCQHACHYCYARFIKRFSGHKEPWGMFVDIKINAADLLRVEVNKKKCARVWISGLCDPYQPLEAKYKLSRKCLEILAYNNWPVTIQTRSSLVLRDMDILKGANDFEVGLTITTADDEIRKLFEPNAPPIKERLSTLDELHRSGIKTYAMIAPILPGAETLVNALEGKVDYVIVDRMNYHYADWIYTKYRLEDKLSDDFFQRTGRELAYVCKKLNIACNLTF